MTTVCFLLCLFVVLGTSQAFVHGVLSRNTAALLGQSAKDTSARSTNDLFARFSKSFPAGSSNGLSARSIRGLPARFLRALSARSTPADTSCTDTAAREAYRTCSQQAIINSPPSAAIQLGQNGYVESITGQQMTQVVQDYCSETNVAKISCFSDWLRGTNCASPDQLLAMAEDTTGLCVNQVPADWITEGILNRLGTLDVSCLNPSFLSHCMWPWDDDNVGISSNQELDVLLNCMTEGMKADESICDKFEVYSVAVGLALLLSDLGVAPSAEFRNSVKDVQFE